MSEFLKEGPAGEGADVLEMLIRKELPEVLDLLLVDRTTSTKRKTRNIIWANDHYVQHGAHAYAPTAEIKPELMTGLMNQIIRPRALKHLDLQRERTRTQAEVFTPTWIVKKQNDEVDQAFLDDDIETYADRKWLEITCGEAPYMVSRYDMETGERIPLAERVGFLDRKLRRINTEVTDRISWQSLTERAFQASYGFEWNGDSLLLARENLLYTYRDFYLDKWQIEPNLDELKRLAEIISYNVFQMDGLTYTVPLSETKQKVAPDVQLSLFETDEPVEEEWEVLPGRRVKVMNWQTGKMEYFDKDVTE